jgi:hypothetical protein
MLVYQGVIEHFIGSNSGYGSVRTKYGNIFSDRKLCVENIEKMCNSLNVKKWSVLEYTLDSEKEPVYDSLY